MSLAILIVILVILLYALSSFSEDMRGGFARTCFLWCSVICGKGVKNWFHPYTFRSQRPDACLYRRLKLRKISIRVLCFGPFNGSSFFGGGALQNLFMSIFLAHHGLR